MIPAPNDDATISRVIRSRREAQTMYNRISGWYDLLEGRWEQRCRAVALDKLAVQPGETVLEIGVGTGHAFVSLAQAVGKAGRLYGIDLSPRMIDLTRCRLKKMGLVDRTSLECGDAVQLNFKAAFFGAIFMSFTLELFDTPEIPQVLAACQRVLRLDGRIGVVSLSQAGETTWMRQIYGWGHRRFPTFLDCRPIFVRQSLEAAGFDILEASRMSMWGLPVEIVLAKK